MNPLITILARGGSKGLPGKNTRAMCGKPLIAWTIEQAIAWGNGVIIVSSDDPGIHAIAELHKCRRLWRPYNLAADSTPKVEAIRHAHRQMEMDDGIEYNPIIDLDVTNPLRCVSDIEGIYKLWQDCRPDTIFSVTKARRSPYFNMVEGRNGYARISKPFNSCVTRRQDCPDCWDLNCCLYVYSRDWLINEKNVSVITDNSMFFEMPEYTFCDTDTLLGFQIVEMLMKENGYDTIR